MTDDNLADNVRIAIDLLGRGAVADTLHNLICEVERLAPSVLHDHAAEIAGDDSLSSIEAARALFRIELLLNQRVLAMALRAMIDAVEHGGRTTVDLAALIAQAAEQTKH